MLDNATGANGGAARKQGGFKFARKTTSPSSNGSSRHGFEYLKNANGTASEYSDSASIFGAQSPTLVKGQRPEEQPRAGQVLEALRTNNDSIASHSYSHGYFEDVAELKRGARHQRLTASGTPGLGVQREEPETQPHRIELDSLRQSMLRSSRASKSCAAEQTSEASASAGPSSHLSTNTATPPASGAESQLSRLEEVVQGRAGAKGAILTKYVEFSRNNRASDHTTASPSPPPTVPPAREQSSNSRSSGVPRYDLLAKPSLLPPRAVDGSPLLGTEGSVQNCAPFIRQPQPQPPPSNYAARSAGAGRRQDGRGNSAKKSTAKREKTKPSSKVRHTRAPRNAATLNGPQTNAYGPLEASLERRLCQPAAPRPVGEAAPTAGGATMCRPCRADPDVTPPQRIPELPTQYPESLAPRQRTAQGAPPNPSFSKRVLTCLQTLSGTVGTVAGAEDITNNSSRSDGSVTQTDEEQVQTMTAGSPLYSYPSTKTPATPADPSAASRANGGVAAQRKSSVLRSGMECLVFDTCSLLESEPGVMNLVLERYCIGIPFTVLDELDRMHKERANTAKNDAALAAAVNRLQTGHDRDWRRRRAHELRNWIAGSLNAEKSHLLVQTRSDVVEEYERRASMNDDHILGYAVYLHRHLGASVHFVTEDKFLRIKAKSELGKVYAYADVRRLVGMPPIPAVPPTTAQATAPAAVNGKGRQKK